MNESKETRLAQYVANRCIEEDHPLTLLQLQAVLWFADALSVSRTGERLFEEPFVAQPLGPRLLSVQSDFFGYGPNPIMRHRPIQDIPAEARDALNEVLPYCLLEDRNTLSEMTRIRGGSYDRTYRNGKGREAPIDGPTAEDLVPLEERFIVPAVETTALGTEEPPTPSEFGL